MKKISKLLFLIILIILSLTTMVYAASVTIKLEAEKQVNSIILHIKLDKIDIDGRGISGFVTDIEYDKNVFETITEDDILSQNGWTDILYNENEGSIVVLRNDFTKTEGEDIVQIKLNKKENTNVSSTTIRLTSIQATNAQHDIDIADSNIKIRFSGIAFGESLIIVVIAIAIIVAILFITRLIIKSNKKRRIKR